MRTPTVVVAADGTDASRSALVWAAGEAQRRGDPLRVVHVLDWDWSAARYEFAGDLFEAERGQAEALVAAAARQARGVAPDLDVETDVLIGDPAAQLIIDSESADLMVLGRRGHGGFAGLRLGSVSQRVATHAHCPVAVIRAEPAVDRPVAAGVDDSAAADRVLEAAFTAAQQRGARLVLIRSYLPPFPRYRGSLPPAELHTPQQDAAERARFAEQVGPWQDKFPDVPVELLLSHSGAASVLVGVSHGAQLIIVGSRGHGVIAGTLLGSTGLQLLHHAGCPVLIVRPGAGR
ncbi:universal stress protein [Actinoplanes teichomyceticus]|uniref:Nucleotide-binding universal stress UspA family protein n=1 Tax=Actinoplanes teichomyceticus TaxID=1867 RepID=A0A561VCA8_ACTTI|nr:universal stress protein [Actinoplanes teichomyceticus]TWG09238.1 nucleotide-binding universal stress UspA family protein [Actinoplanes teichomyceticus]